jgi:hypothetical protein
MPETTLRCKAIMPNNQHLMKKNCLHRHGLEIKLRHRSTLFPFLSFYTGTTAARHGGD